MKRLRCGSRLKSSSDTAVCRAVQSAGVNFSIPVHSLALISSHAAFSSRRVTGSSKDLSGLEMNRKSNRKVESGVKPLADSEQREQRVVRCREASPQIDQTVFARSDLHQKLLLGQRAEQLVRPVHIFLHPRGAESMSEFSAAILLPPSPIPLDDPVTTATFPFSLLIVSLSLYSVSGFPRLSSAE